MPKPNAMVIHAVVDREGEREDAGSPSLGVDEWTLNEWGGKKAGHSTVRELRLETVQSVLEVELTTITRKSA